MHIVGSVNFPYAPDCSTYVLSGQEVYPCRLCEVRLKWCGLTSELYSGENGLLIRNPLLSKGETSSPPPSTKPSASPLRDGNQNHGQNAHITWQSEVTQLVVRHIPTWGKRRHLAESRGCRSYRGRRRAQGEGNESRAGPQRLLAQSSVFASCDWQIKTVELNHPTLYRAAAVCWYAPVRSAVTWKRRKSIGLFISRPMWLLWRSRARGAYEHSSHELRS